MAKSLMLFLLMGVVVSAGCSTDSSSGSPVAEAADLKTAAFSVEGMTCSGCEAGVKMAVRKLDGVHEVEASYEESKARVTYDPANTGPDQIEAAIEKLGYRVRLEVRESTQKK